MRFSKLMLTTRKESGAKVDILSQELLVRAGYIRQLSSGIFSSLHLGFRSLRKIEDILREEMNAIGGVEISMPVVHSADIWKKTNRYDDIDDSLVRFTDRAGRDMVLAMTHEEVVASIAKSEITSYKQLPKLVYQIQTKFRDEARSRGGLIRVREFIMKDSYSLDTSVEGLEKQYQAHYDAYFKMFIRAGLPVIAIQSDTGMMGGKIAHEYMYITEIGEDTIFICENTGYQANKEVASIQKTAIEVEPKDLEEVLTPNMKTIAELSEFLGVQPENCGKVVFYSAEIGEETKIVIAVVRGDMEVNETKLQNMVKAKTLVAAQEEEITKIGSVAGYASPIGVDREQAIVVVDDLIEKSNNLVVGANKENYHLKNACYGRDFSADHVGDIINAFDGAISPDAKSPNDTLKSVRGVEAGNIFQLGTKYTSAFDADFMDVDGRPKPIIMGSYGIGVGRLLGCLAQEYHDDKGLKLPITVAPYEVIIIGLLDKEEITEKAEQIYSDLKAAKIDVLFDDRGKKVASPGQKFNDADLIGIPIHITISKRSLKNGGADVKLRGEEGEVVALEDVAAKVQEKINMLHAEIENKLKAEEWKA